MSCQKDSAGLCYHKGPCNKEQGTKADNGKIQLDLLSSVAILELGKVLTFGAQKYDRHNWRRGIVYSRILGAALRHLVAYLGGESKDPESGLSHMAHVMCCAMFILEFEATKPELDDRYRPRD